VSGPQPHSAFGAEKPWTVLGSRPGAHWSSWHRAAWSTTKWRRFSIRRGSRGC